MNNQPDECELLHCFRLAGYKVHDKSGVYADHKVCRLHRLNYPDRTRYTVTKIGE